MPTDPGNVRNHILPSRWRTVIELPWKTRKSKQIEERNRQFQASFDLAAVGLAHVALDGSWLRVNQKLCAILGYSRDELLGKTFQEISHPDDLKDDLDALRRLLAREIDQYAMEKRYLRKDRSILWANLSVTLASREDGAPDFFVSVIEDIQARKTLQEHLSRQRGFLQTLIRTLPDLVWLKDPEGTYLACNPSFEQFFGAREKEIIGKTDFDFVEREQAESFRLHDQKAMERGGPSLNEEWLRFASDGHEALVETTKTPMFDGAGQLIGILGIAHDITERHELLEQLQDKEFFLNESQRAARIGSYKADFLANRWYSSKVLDEIFGIGEHYDRSIEGWGELVHPEDRVAVTQHLTEEVIKGGSEFHREYRIRRHSDGAEVWVLGLGQTVHNDRGEVIALIGTIQEISQRKHREEALNKGESRWKRLVENVPDILYQYSSKRGGLYYSPQVERVFGHSADYMLEHPWLWPESIHPDDQERVRGVIGGLTEGDAFAIDYRVRDAEGQWHCIYDRSIGCQINGDELVIEGLAMDVTEARQQEATLKERDEQLGLLIEHAPAALSMLDSELNYLVVSNRWREDYGLGQQPLIGRSHYQVFPEIPDHWKQAHQRALAGEALSCTEDRFVRANGQVQWLRWEVRPWHRADGCVGGIIVLTENVTERHLARERIEKALAAQKQATDRAIAAHHQAESANQQMRKLSMAVNQSPESIVITDVDARIEYVNDTFRRRTGYSLEEVQGQNPRILHSGKTPKETYTAMWQTLVQGRVWKGQFINKAKDGSEYTEIAIISPMRKADGSITHFVAVKEDISVHLALVEQLRDSEQNYAHAMQHDGLTGLPNRSLFADRLSQAIRTAHRRSASLAVLYIDLDEFKQVNDSFDHQVGDAVLREVTVRLKALIREDDTLARMGADEFALLMEAVDDSNDAAVLSQKLLDTFDAPFQVNDHQIFLGASIGIALYPTHGVKADELIRNADSAMYRAKEHGRKTFHYYSEELTSKAFERVLMESSLRNALKAEQFILHYQPQFSCHDQAITGFEALVRWSHPDRGMVPPGRFIPLAEQSGLILPIGQWVLEEACRQMQAWIRQGRCAADALMCVNLSGRQFDQPDLVERVEAVLSTTGLSPQNLELEVTESTVARSAEVSVRVLNQLRELGVKVAIDDFGTGYSSLNHLKNLPLTKLKIDQSFVRDIPQDRSDMAIAKAIIALGTSLCLEVLAEGIETEQQLDFLSREGCETGQGYWFARPQTAIDLESGPLLEIK